MKPRLWYCCGSVAIHHDIATRCSIVVCMWRVIYGESIDTPCPTQRRYKASQSDFVVTVGFDDEHKHTRLDLSLRLHYGGSIPSNTTLRPNHLVGSAPTLASNFSTIISPWPGICSPMQDSRHPLNGSKTCILALRPKVLEE